MLTRQTLPNRRCCETLEIEHAGHRFSLTFSSYHDGRIAEIFLNAHKSGSGIEAISRDAAIVASIALQFGAPVGTVHAALTRDHDGGTATLLGAALAAITEISK
jgi:hypothetical protein